MEFLNINPIFLFILFAMGYVFGLLIRNPSAGKFLIFGFAGIFIYEPVKDAGLLASGAFVFGIIVHHISLLSIFDSFQLYRATKAVRDHVEQEKNQRYSHKPQDENLGSKGGAGGRSESADETHQKYEDYRRQKAQKEQKDHSQQTTGQQSKAKPKQDRSHDAEKEKMRQQQKRMKREQDRLNKEKERFRQEQASAKPAKDTRTDEEVLGLKGEYTLSDLKKAWRAEVARWHPDQLGNKPPHLRKQAEEELKRINGAYERLRDK